MKRGNKERIIILEETCTSIATRSQHVVVMLSFADCIIVLNFDIMNLNVEINDSREKKKTKKKQDMGHRHYFSTILGSMIVVVYVRIHRKHPHLAMISFDSLIRQQTQGESRVLNLTIQTAWNKHQTGQSVRKF